MIVGLRDVSALSFDKFFLQKILWFFGCDSPAAESLDQSKIAPRFSRAFHQERVFAFTY
jgi:hypothetical protein